MIMSFIGVKRCKLENMHYLIYIYIDIFVAWEIHCTLLESFCVWKIYFELLLLLRNTNLLLKRNNVIIFKPSLSHDYT